MKISEHFVSFQGEGRYTGIPCLFVRLQGCNLTCSFCDTKYTWNKDKGIEMTVNQIVALINQHKHVVFTGGEPLLQMDELKQVIASSDAFVEIETNGTLFNDFIPRLVKMGKVHVNVSPKTDFWSTKYLETILMWNGHCDYKFVIRKLDKGGMAELDFVKKLITRHHLRNVILMPEGIDSQSIIRGTRELLEEIKKQNLQGIRVATRLHVILHENKRGV